MPTMEIFISDYSAVTGMTCIQINQIYIYIRSYNLNNILLTVIVII